MKLWFNCKCKCFCERLEEKFFYYWNWLVSSLFISVCPPFEHCIWFHGEEFTNLKMLPSCQWHWSQCKGILKISYRSNSSVC